MINLGNVFILGDSYSTFEGYVPKDYAVWYTNAGHENTDVNRVEQTWWQGLINETDSKLLLNCSYSGTTVCNTGYNNSDCTHISFIGRTDKLIESDYFKENRVDTFFIFGGTNDSWANSPVGELMYSNLGKEYLFSVLPAFCYLLERLKGNLQSARIICIINTELKPEITDNFMLACEKYGVEYIKLEAIDKTAGHPNIRGMEQIKNQVLDFLNK